MSRDMVRDLDQLTARTFDLVVVGGGIYGLTIAADAAQRGLSVALIERADFGSGSSFNHLRTIHGGLRYLQTLDIGRARESIRERRTLARIAPHAVRPVLFALPLYRSALRGKLAMRAGFLVDQLLAADRNRGVPPSLRIPRGRVVSRGTAIDRFPGLRRKGLTGAAIWYDYLTPESDRLTFSWATKAAELGAAVANYVEAFGLLRDGRRVTGVRVADTRTGRELEVGGRLVVDATGAAMGQLLGGAGIETRMPLVKAMNLVTRRDAGDEALGGRSASGRNLFLVPWRNRAIFGTWESTRPCVSDDARPTEGEIESFVAELNQAFPTLELRMDDITLVHHGTVPAKVAPNGRVALEGHEQVQDPASEGGLDGILGVAGAKYTTARAVAERIVDRVLSKLQQSAVACRTAATPLPGGDLVDFASEIADARRKHDAALPGDTIPHLIAAYGSRYEQVLDLTSSQAGWRARIAKESPVIGAELVWAARREMVVTLADAVVRRTPLGALGYPGDGVAERAADIVGAELGWTADRRRQELGELRAFYSIR